LGAFGIVESNVYKEGGQGGIELAQMVQNACKASKGFRYLYPPDLPIKEKIKRVAKAIYGAKEVQFSDEANKKALALKKVKMDKLPVSIVKTPFSLSYNPKRRGRPHGFKFPIEDIQIYNGAGYIAAFSSNVVMMPGLPKAPRATKIDVNEEGRLVGLI
jgi:formate--tetrahydrofolate ligase